ncbi:MAG: GAF domain-containing protein [Anaerolineae bacterium]|nr:GAF domain-containing protein [Anaerolineae bacterium]
MGAESRSERQSEYTTRYRRLLLAGGVGVSLSLVLIVWAATGSPGSAVVRWLALLPAAAALVYGVIVRAYWPVAETAETSARLADELRQANDALRKQVKDQTAARDLMLALGSTFDRKEILDELVSAITDMLRFDRGLVLVFDEDKNALTFGAYSHAAPDPDNQLRLEQLEFSLVGRQNDPLIGAWIHGQSVLVEEVTPYLKSDFNWVLTMLDLRLFYTIPLTIGDRLKGVLLVDNSPTNLPIAAEQCSLLDALGANLAVTLENARLYYLTDEQLNLRVQELQILSRIDRELNYVLSVERVLNLTLDWALRFTGSHVAAVALVNPDRTQLKFLSGYGYDPVVWEQMKKEPWPLEKGITGRVVRTGEAIVTPDVTVDPDYVAIEASMRSQLAVPLTREDRVIAVITLHSRNLDGFSTGNLDFVQRLAARAAVAIDNANLFDQTRRESQKLELILRSTADAVIVVDEAERLVLINQAALALFKLSPKVTYVGHGFKLLRELTPLYALFDRASGLNQGLIEQVQLSEDRTFHVSIVPAPQVGWSIVMHDVTPFKKTEQLKNELLATTSHDLKNPLGSMLGYLDLIMMTNTLNAQGQEYMKRAQRSISHMRQLIDDLLDMARIESGITLRYTRVHLPTVIRQATEQVMVQVREKAMDISVEVPPNFPPVYADASRLSQILTNLLSNAIKYTPPEGHIWIRAEPLAEYVQVVIQDNGLGIGPEDQARVFDRFYRVRTPETEAIEGTGLGLAIVKSLVEAHGGQIGLESHLGCGSTLTFTLPLGMPPDLESNGSAEPDEGADAGNAADEPHLTNA